MKQRLASIFRLAFPYIIMALLPIFSVVVLSSYIVQNHTEKVISNQNSAIEVAVDRVSQKMASIVELSYLIESNNNVQQYVINQNTGVGNDLEACNDVRDLLSGVAMNDEIAEAYFYDADTGRIIASSSVLNGTQMFFEYQYQYLDRTPEEAMTRLQSYGWGHGYERMEQVLIDMKLTEVIEYRLSVPLHRYGENQSQLVIALNARVLFQDLFDVLSEEAGFCIYGANGLIYSSTDQYQDMAQKPMNGMLTLTESASGEVYCAEHLCNNTLWRVRFFYPEISDADSRWSMLRSLLPAITLPVLLCVIACVYFTHKNRRDIEEILALLRGEVHTEEAQSDPAPVDYQLVRSYADRVVAKNRDYRTKLQQIHISQKNSVLERLVRNVYRSKEEIQQALSTIELRITYDRCAVMCIQFDDINGEQIIINDITLRDMITDILQNQIGTEMEVFDNLSTEIVCIISVDKDFDMVIDNMISLLNVQIKYQYGIDLKIGVGNVVDSVLEIGTSYNQAREVIRYSESTGSSNRLYNQLDSVEEVMFYPVQTADKISNYMIAGRAEEAKEVILGIYFENFRDNPNMLSMNTIDLVKYRIARAVMSVAEKQGVEIPESSKRFLKEKNVKNYFTALTELVDVIVREIMTKKNNAQNVLALKIGEYVQEHYADCGLSIKQIANNFHFHENYISNLYKEEYGENLSTAIERLRISKACQLLTDTDTRVNEVASAVGYSSDSSFRRAFKKIMGVSPVDYRNSH